MTSVLLTRLLALKDVSPFVLLLDSVEQTANYILLEFIHRAPKNTTILYLSFESSLSCDGATVLDCCKLSVKEIHDKVRQIEGQSLILIDSLSQINDAQLTQFVVGLIRPHSTLVGICHTPSERKTSYTPSQHTQLTYLATTIITVAPPIEHDVTDSFLLPLNAHSSTFTLTFLHRRKSGRAVQGSFKYVNGSFEQLTESTVNASQEHAQTTFTIGLTEKQKKARDLVELPYINAQNGNEGGAIVYQFEEEDDYDEEDPYEDPF